MQQKQISKLNPQWVRQTLGYFKQFLKVTKFPHPVRNGDRGSEFEYPEWMIMFIAIVSVKAHAKTYLGIHDLSTRYWNVIAEGTGKENKPISERQLRDRLKKVCHSLRKKGVHGLKGG